MGSRFCSVVYLYLLYVHSLFVEDVNFFCDFFKLRFHIIPEIKIRSNSISACDSESFA
jgi:hypothetical protein